MRRRTRTPADCHGPADAARSCASAGAVVLVDVREPREFDTGHLEGAINIPITELQRRIKEIPPQANPVFICRSGSRSLAACAMAARAGITVPGHLEGGLLAWAAEVDPTLAVAAAG